MAKRRGKSNRAQLLHPERRVVDGQGYHYDPQEADRWLRFFDQLLVHTKGQYAGQPFTLEAWQEDDIRAVFGWRHDTTLARLVREWFMAEARKNGKSTEVSGLALGLLVLDNEPVAEIYGCAGDKDQAKLCHEQAKQMVLASPELNNRLEVYRDVIVDPATWSTYKAISADAGTKHGLNPHGVLFDELHVQRSRDLWDTMTTAQASRRQPLTIAMTTAGDDKDSICWEVWDHARAVRDGEIHRPDLHVSIHEVPEDADWRDEANWKLANPNLGVSVSLEYLRAEARKAEAIPGRQFTFRRLHLNQWVEGGQVWLPVDLWDAAEYAIDLEALDGRRCWPGVDLGATRDITALVYVFPPADPEAPPDNLDSRYLWVERLWIPEARAKARQDEEKLPYLEWADQGYIELAPGRVVDHAVVLQDLVERSGHWDLQEISVDPWQGYKLIADLEDAGLLAFAHRQGVVSMTGPCRSFESLLLEGKLAHAHNPVTRRAVRYAQTEGDAADNIKPSKRRSRDRIDPLVAGIMGLGRAVADDGEAPSVYDERGIQVWG